MAEAILLKHSDGSFEVFSAGIDPKGIHPMTIRVLEEIGVDTSGLESKSLEQYANRDDIDYVIILCANAERNCPVFQRDTKREHWGFEDPGLTEGSENDILAKFREIRDLIDSRIQTWIAEIEPNMLGPR